MTTIWRNTTQGEDILQVVQGNASWREWLNRNSEPVEPWGGKFVAQAPKRTGIWYNFVMPKKYSFRLGDIKNVVFFRIK